MRPFLFLIMLLTLLPLVSAIVWDNKAYYTLNETSGTRSDSTGRFNMTVVGTVNSDRGIINNSYRGSGVEANVGNMSGVLGGASNYTISFWYNRTGTFAVNNWIFGSNVSTEIALNHNSCGGGDDELSLRVSQVCYGTNINSTTGRGWQHIVLIVNVSNRVNVYQNNTLVSNLSMTTGVRSFKGSLFLGSSDGTFGIFTTDQRVDEFGIWNRTLNSSDVSQLWNNGVGSSYQGLTTANAITISLDAPINNQVFNIRNVSFNATLTPTNVNLTNATLYIYNASDAIINNTNTNNVTGNVANNTNWSVANLALGHYKYNVYGCGTYGTIICNFASENKSFTIGATILSESYTATVFETSRQQFNISIVLTSGSTLTLAQLVYNETNYTVSDITRGGENYNLSRTIDIPKNPNAWANTTRNFFWRFQFSNAQSASQETTTRQQNVSFINLQICNTTYPTSGINYTTRDENTTAIINSIYETTVNYWLGSGTEQKNYSTNFSTSVQSAYNFCIFPINQTFKVDQDASFTAPNYVDRTHYLRNASIRNDSKVVDLFLLQSAFATKFFITAQEGVSALANAIITIDKYYVGEGIFKTIGIRKSDSAGKFIEYLEIDNDYRLTITKDGVNYGITEKNAHCPEAPCNFIIFANPSASNIFSTYYDEFATSINSNISFNATSGIVSYNFIDLTGLANYFQLIVKKVQSNQSNLVVCDQTLNSVSGTITCNMSGQTGDFLAEGIINRSPNKIDKILGFTIGEIKQALGLIAIFISLAIVVTMVFAGGAVSRGNPVVVIAFFMVAIVGLKLMGIFPFSWVFVSVICLISIVIIGWIKT